MHPVRFLADIWRHRHVVRLLARREFRSRYMGLTLGVFWIFAQPAAMVLIFWLVFSTGLRLGGSQPGGFLPHFISGLVPWLMFSEVLLMGTNGIRGNLQLIKRVPFPSEVLPLVYIVAASIGQAVILLITMAVLALGGVHPGLSLLLLPGYFLGLCALLLGLCWITSALNVFHRDIGQSVGIVINLWFWLTPVVWDRHMFAPELARLLALNPMTFIVEGYRSALLGAGSAAGGSADGAIFVAVTATVFLLGATVFARLKFEFADSY